MYTLRVNHVYIFVYTWLKPVDLFEQLLLKYICMEIININHDYLIDFKCRTGLAKVPKMRNHLPLWIINHFILPVSFTLSKPFLLIHLRHNWLQWYLKCISWETDFCKKTQQLYLCMLTCIHTYNCLYIYIQMKSVSLKSKLVNSHTNTKVSLLEQKSLFGGSWSYTYTKCVVKKQQFLHVRGFQKKKEKDSYNKITR